MPKDSIPKPGTLNPPQKKQVLNPREFLNPKPQIPNFHILRYPYVPPLIQERPILPLLTRACLRKNPHARSKIFETRRALRVGHQTFRGTRLRVWAYSPPQVDRIWGIGGPYYNIPKAIFYLLQADYRVWGLAFRVWGVGLG